MALITEAEWETTALEVLAEQGWLTESGPLGSPGRAPERREVVR